MLTAEIPGDPPCVSGDLIMRFITDDETREWLSDETWPDERMNVIWKALPAGRYIITLENTDSGWMWALTDDGWAECEESILFEMPENMFHEFEAGTFRELPREGLTDEEDGQPEAEEKDELKPLSDDE